VAAQVAPVGGAQLGQGGPVAVDLGGVDVQGHQVLGRPAGRGQGGDQVAGGDLELLGQGRPDDPPVGALGGLAAQVDGAAGGGDDRVGEPDRRGQALGVHHPMGRAWRPIGSTSRSWCARPHHRPRQVGERPWVKAA
jgi:hypothetical protein